MANLSAADRQNRADLTAERIRGDIAVTDPYRDFAIRVGGAIRANGTPDPAAPDDPNRATVQPESYKAIMADVDAALDYLYPRYRGAPSQLQDSIEQSKKSAFTRAVRTGADQYAAIVDTDPELAGAMTDGR